MVRFSTHKFSLKNISDKFVHLTNFSINKRNTNFVKNEGKSANNTEYVASGDHDETTNEDLD